MTARIGQRDRGIACGTFAREVELSQLGMAVRVAHIDRMARGRPVLRKLAGVIASLLVTGHAHKRHVVQCVGIGGTIAVGGLIVARGGHVVVGPAHGGDESELVGIREVALFRNGDMARVVFVRLGDLHQRIQLFDGYPAPCELVVVLDKDFRAFSAIGGGFGIYRLVHRGIGDSGLFGCGRSRGLGRVGAVRNFGVFASCARLAHGVLRNENGVGVQALHGARQARRN